MNRLYWLLLQVFGTVLSSFVAVFVLGFLAPMLLMPLSAAFDLSRWTMWGIYRVIMLAGGIVSLAGFWHMFSFLRRE